MSQHADANVPFAPFRIILGPEGSIGHTFHQNQTSFSPFGQHEMSVLSELTLGHLGYHLTDAPPQPNSPPD